MSPAILPDPGDDLDAAITLLENTVDALQARVEALEKSVYGA